MYTPLCVRTHYSMLQSTVRPDKIANKAKELGLGAIVMTDRGNVGGCVKMTTACKDAGVKLVLGNDFYICPKDDPTDKSPENSRPYGGCLVYAANKKGWQNILQAVSASTSKEYKFVHPRLSVESLRDYFSGNTGDNLCVVGNLYSDLSNALFREPKLAYLCADYEILKSEHLRPDAQERFAARLEHYLSIFGHDNIYLGLDKLGQGVVPAELALEKAVRWSAKKYKLPIAAMTNTHYIDHEGASDQRLLLCSHEKTTLRQIRTKAMQSFDPYLDGFFRSNTYHLPAPSEMESVYSEEELKNTIRFIERCENVNILSNPHVPEFACPNGMDSVSYLRQLCEEGFRKFVTDRETLLDHSIEVYRQRLEMELGVINGAGLAPYFLIVQDIIQYGKSRGWHLGCGRGSAGGCLVSYLAGITSIDPIHYDLIFERFYNAGRNTDGNVSWPDIDMDFPVYKRDEIFSRTQKKYGKDKVSTIATYTTLQGKSALDEVMMAYEIPFDQRKEITKLFPDKSCITEELQDMEESGEEPSIIRYTLGVYADELSDWVVERDDGKLDGEFASYFEQGIRLEGLIKNPSQHAAGVVISAIPIAEFCPVTYDESADTLVANMGHEDVEKVGGLKVDLLGVAMLDKGEGIQQLALTGEIHKYA